jgi:hypothetical protein
MIHEDGTATIRINIIAEDQVTTKTYSIQFRTDLSVVTAQTDASGQIIKLTFNQPLAPESIVAGAFLVHVGSIPIIVEQAVYSSSDGTTVDLYVNEPLYKWDRITVDMQGGGIQSVLGSQLTATAAMDVQNEITVFSPDFPDPNDIHINNIIAFLNRRHFDVDANRDGSFDRSDIRMLLFQIQPISR